MIWSNKSRGFRRINTGAAILLCGAFFILQSCQSANPGEKKASSDTKGSSSEKEIYTINFKPVYGLLVVPKNPEPGEKFRIISAGGEEIPESVLSVTGNATEPVPLKIKSGDEIPYWRIDEFTGLPAGKYKVALNCHNKEIKSIELNIAVRAAYIPSGMVWKSERGWDRSTEILYSAWINSLYSDCSEQDSWTSLHDVIRTKEKNFLYNNLSLGEDDPDAKYKLVMQPDCADNPFFLRAYFSWKVGLPFGYHICDRGYVGKNPGTGEWITNEIKVSQKDPGLHLILFYGR